MFMLTGCKDKTLPHNPKIISPQRWIVSIADYQHTAANQHLFEA